MHTSAFKYDICTYRPKDVFAITSNPRRPSTRVPINIRPRGYGYTKESHIEGRRTFDESVVSGFSISLSPTLQYRILRRRSRCPSPVSLFPRQPSAFKRQLLCLIFSNPSLAVPRPGLAGIQDYSRPAIYSHTRRSRWSKVFRIKFTLITAGFIYENNSHRFKYLHAMVVVLRSS